MIALTIGICPETGGLFRIAVKLMMACATKNVTV